MICIKHFAAWAVQFYKLLSDSDSDSVSNSKLANIQDSRLVFVTYVIIQNITSSEM